MNNEEPHTPSASLAFLTGGGDVGALMRARDWSDSPLGYPDDWPQSLRTLVGLMLNSKFPMFLAWGPELAFLYNDSYAEILGTKHPSALGSRFDDIWSEIWDDISPMIDSALKGHATYAENLPLKMRRRGYDEDTWFTFSYSPVRDESGKVAGMYCACTETTNQVLAERNRIEENKRLLDLFRQAPGVMAVVRGPQHVFELTNDAYLQLIGYRDIVGKPVRDALPEVEGQGFVKLLDQVYASGEPFIGNAVPIKLQRQPDSALEERFVDFIYQPIRDATGAVVGIFAEGSDVTERQRAIEELRASDRRKDEFLAMLAHELRNPLAPISTAAQLLKLKAGQDESIRNASAIISRQVEHMTDLVNDLLDVSRVTRGLVALDKERLDINVIVANAVEQVRTLIDSRLHKLTLELAEGPVQVEGDRTRLVQVISNILNNAAKYTPLNGEITLRVLVHAEQVEIAVRDNGAGINQEILPYIFDLFTQAERTPDRSQGGLGLGLALVKSLVGLHGGTVEARSNGGGQGSEFSIRLPRLQQGCVHSLPEQVRATTPMPEAMLRVMVVDDNADAAQTLTMLLEAEGHSVSVEHDAHSAIECARLESPHVFLLDIGLPDMDGYELARRIRAMPGMDRAVLVALTGYGQSKDRERSKQAGFDHHLVKPANRSQLAGVLAQVNTSAS